MSKVKSTSGPKVVYDVYGTQIIDERTWFYVFDGERWIWVDSDIYEPID